MFLFLFLSVSVFVCLSLLSFKFLSTKRSRGVNLKPELHYDLQASQLVTYATLPFLVSDLEIKAKIVSLIASHCYFL